MSKTITLIRAAVVRGGIRPSGYTAEVDDATYQALLDRGVIEPEAEPERQVAEVDDAEAPEAVAAAEESSEPVLEPTPAAGEPGVKLPPMTAPIAVWREFAESPKVGIKTAGMKKPEIIGAVKHYLAQ